MACNNCSETSIQFECGDSPRLICVQLPTDPTAIPAWAVPVCNGEDELTGVSLFYDEAATVPLVGYTLANRVPCPQSLLGLSCASSVKADLCPSSLNPILTAIDSAGEEIEEAIAAQTAALQASISAQTSAIQGTVESVGEEIEERILTQTVQLQSTAESVGEEIERAIETSVVGYNSAGAALPANFNSLAQTLNYTGSNLTSIVKTNGVNTWTQTFTYTGDNVTGISAWVQS